MKSEILGLILFVIFGRKVLSTTLLKYSTAAHTNQSVITIRDYDPWLRPVITTRDYETDFVLY